MTPARRAALRGVVLALLAAPLLPGAPAATTPPVPPEPFVRALYAAYADPRDLGPLGPRAPTIFSTSLLALIRADQGAARDGPGKLDGDPICDCQDPGGLRLLSVTLAPGNTASAARVTARFRIMADPRSVTLHLVNTPNGWRVDDVSVPDDPSLRRTLGGR